MVDAGKLDRERIEDRATAFDFDIPKST